MSKRPSLTKQVVDRLNSLARFGQSKYEAKQQAIAESRAAGAVGWNPARIEGIYSIETMKTYRKEAIAFTNWAKQEHGCKYLSDAVSYAAEYLQNKMRQGNSAWSLQTSRAALRKLYQDSRLANEIKLPIRSKTEITRSRGSKAMDSKFSREKHRDLIDFCRAAGLRRHELQALKKENIIQGKDRVWVFVEKGKGGRPRTVPVLRALQERVVEVAKDKQPDEHIFRQIPVRADIHGYRREYATALYKEWAGKQYSPGNKDKQVMRVVSTALGHNRLDVVCRNYLDCD